jgi:hypothetical protein
MGDFGLVRIGRLAGVHPHLESGRRCGEVIIGPPHDSVMAAKPRDPSVVDLVRMAERASPGVMDIMRLYERTLAIEEDERQAGLDLVPEIAYYTSDTTAEC